MAAVWSWPNSDLHTRFEPSPFRAYLCWSGQAAQYNWLDLQALCIAAQHVVQGGSIWGRTPEPHKGMFVSNNGYEFGLALLAASVALLISGAGRLSVDASLAARTSAITQARPGASSP